MMQRTASAVAETAAREELASPAVLGVTLLTSADEETLKQLGINEQPSELVRRLAALAKSSGLDGVVASGQEIKVIRETVTEPGFLIVCPGMRSAKDAANDQRRTMSVVEAIRAGADYLVVGRPILTAPDPVAAASAIQEEIDQALIPAST
jgi:orotidine-5'-phosphate decarboxylase